MDTKNRNGLPVFQFELVTSKWIKMLLYSVIWHSASESHLHDKITPKSHLKQSLLNLEKEKTHLQKTTYTHSILTRKKDKKTRTEKTSIQSLIQCS